jgi:hypothetical protein
MPPASGIAVSIVELEAVRVAIVRAIVAMALHDAGASPAGLPFARYFSMSPEGLDVATGFPVAEPFLGAGVVHPGELPAGPAAVTTHIGPFEGLEAAWMAFRATIDQLGRRRADDPWEVYFVGPGSGVDEAEWRTELVWPLEPEEPAEPLVDSPDRAAASTP